MPRILGHVSAAFSYSPGRITGLQPRSTRAERKREARRTSVDEELEVALADVRSVKAAHRLEARLLERMQRLLVPPHLDQPEDVVRLVARARNDDVLGRHDEEALPVGGGTQAVVAALVPLVVAQADRVARELLAVTRNDAQLGTRPDLSLRRGGRLVVLVVIVFVAVVLDRVREDEKVARCATRGNARDHAVELEDGRHFDKDLRRARQARHSPPAVALPDDGDLDDVGPRDEERPVVAPVQAALEQVGARTAFGSADVRDALARRRVVYSHSLRVERASIVKQTMGAGKHARRRSPTR